MHRLSLRISFVSAAAALAALLLITLLAGLPTWYAASGGLAAGLAAYLASCLLVAPRLGVARETLEQIRSHQFEGIKSAVRVKGDEADALLFEVQRTGAALEREIRELKRMENYRREFIGNVSHELKTPIFAVQGFAETLLDGALEDERVRRGFVEKILRNASRLGNMARDLSEISRIETGEIRLNPTAFSLERLIHEVVESLEVQAREKGIHLASQVSRSLPLAYADRESIRHVLINLIDNAIKYNDPEGRVEVVARVVRGSELRTSVVDNGIGLAPEDVPRVTERFFRVDKSRSRSQGGTGLGLAIVKHLLAAHDSKLIVESTLGSGSTFSFTLPRASSPPEARH